MIARAVVVLTDEEELIFTRLSCVSRLASTALVWGTADGSNKSEALSLIHGGCDNDNDNEISLHLPAFPTDTAAIFA